MDSTPKQITSVEAKKKKNLYAREYYKKNKQRILDRNRAKYRIKVQKKCKKPTTTRYFKTMHFRRIRRVNCEKHQESIIKFANGCVGIIIETEQKWKYIVYKNGKYCFSSYKLFDTKVQCAKDLQNCML
jgi:GH35 family endo-1,4-beta-xylanase